jgi:hypothetical protein
MHAAQDHLLVGNHRRGALIPKEMVGSKPGGKVVRPADRAVQLERGEATTAEVNEDALAISNGRRIAARTKLALFGRAFLSEPRQPQLLAVNVQRQDGIVSRVGGSQESFQMIGVELLFPGKANFQDTLSTVQAVG